MGHRVVRIEVENFKRLRTVAYDAQPHTNIVGGDNANGKSSLLDAIQGAIAGGRALPDQPIHKGAKRADIKIDLGNGCHVHRRFYKTKKGEEKSELLVINADGEIIDRPQTTLDGLCKWGIAFDPLQFMQAEPKQQLTVLSELVGFDWDAWERKRKALMEERRDVKRDLKKLEAQLDKAPKHSGVPDDAPDVKDLLAEIEKAREHNAQVERSRTDLAGIRERIDSATAEMKRLKLAFDEMKVRRTKLEAEAEAIERHIDDAVILDDAPLKEQLDSAEEVARKVRENIEWAAINKELNDCQSSSALFTQRLEDLDKQRDIALASADLPVEDLHFSDDGVTYQGLPLSQASQAEQLRVSAAIGMRLNPDMRIMLVRDGSLLDDDSLECLCDMARAEDCQIWIERVGHGKECTIVIEDGEAKETANGK